MSVNMLISEAQQELDLQMGVKHAKGRTIRLPLDYA